VKVVLFCGGYGMRMRDGVDDLPKPMAKIDERPLLWHVMRYYAHFGYRDFILCLGYGASHITDYFLTYQETRSNDFVIDSGRVQLLSTDIADWRITFVHTGLDTPIGERLRRVRDHLDGEDVFLANYADVLTDAPLDVMVDRLLRSDAAASMMAVPPQSAVHMVESGDDGRVEAIRSIASMPIRENGGYFVLRREVLDELAEGEDLVTDALARLAERGRVLSYAHDGFWMPADTVKERARLEQLAAHGHAPWQVWHERDRSSSSGAAPGVVPAQATVPTVPTVPGGR
jgi:glucose-1-phosphate cytidylyltransferase